MGGPWGQAAAAHDVLVDTSPAEGASVDAAPDAVELTFNNTPQDQFAQIAVTSEDGSEHQEGEPAFNGSTIAQPVGNLPDGEYTVSYRVVSSDGHPISGTFTFAVGVPVSEGSTETADPTPSAEPSETPTEAAGAEDDDGPSTPVIILVVLVAAAAIAGIAFVAVGGWRRGESGDTGA